MLLNSPWTCLIVPSCEQWIVCRWTRQSVTGLTINSLLLNCSKTRKITFRSITGKHDGRTAQIPRASRKLLAWTTRRGRGWQNDSCRLRQWPISVLLYAQPRTAASMKDVFRSAVLGKLLYCSPASSGFCSVADCVRLQAVLRRCQRLSYCSKHSMKRRWWAAI